MKFSLEKSIEILERTPSVLNSLLGDLSEEWVFQNEGEGTWSPFDILGHLIHGERTDWIVRTEIILEKRNHSFEPFDRFAQLQASRKSMDQLLETFETLRNSNLEKLKNLNITESDLDLKGVHPELGPVTLKNLLATWTAHDLSHISQIARVMAKSYKSEVGIWTKYMKIMHQ